MYLAVTATNMYTQTLPDYKYASQISAYKYMLHITLHIHIFYDHDDNNIPPTYPMRLLIKDILFINIKP